jgi:hypothetical protein
MGKMGKTARRAIKAMLVFRVPKAIKVMLEEMG